jgi:hypothetical protein
MSKEREAKILETLEPYRQQETLRLVVELLTLRRERHRDRLESEESEELRGRAKECKDLLSFLSVAG